MKLKLLYLHGLWEDQAVVRSHCTLRNSMKCKRLFMQKIWPSTKQHWKWHAVAGTLTCPLGEAPGSWEQPISPRLHLWSVAIFHALPGQFFLSGCFFGQVQSQLTWAVAPCVLLYWCSPGNKWGELTCGFAQGVCLAFIVLRHVSSPGQTLRCYKLHKCTQWISVEVWPGLRRGHWHGLPRLSSSPAAALLLTAVLFELLVRPTSIRIDISVHTAERLAFWTQSFSFVRVHSPSGNFLCFLCSSCSSWCPWEAGGETRTAGHMVQQAQVRSVVHSHVRLPHLPPEQWSRIQ